jgi:hypothetical protein
MQNRTVATTYANDRSSRAHTIFRVVIESRLRPEDVAAAAAAAAANNNNNNSVDDGAPAAAAVGR